MRTLLPLLLGAALASPLAAQRYTCTTSSYGKSCGPVLTMTATPNGNTHRIAAKVSNAKPGGRLIFMVGAMPIDVPLGAILPSSSSCRLLVAPVFLQQHVADAAGTYVYERSLPSTAPGTGYVQFLEVRGTAADEVVLATNGGKVECK